MGSIKVIRKGDGTAFKNKRDQFVFVKDGVHFSLSIDQMEQVSDLFQGLKDGSLMQIDPDTPEMAKGE